MDNGLLLEVTTAENKKEYKVLILIVMDNGLLLIVGQYQICLI